MQDFLPSSNSLEDDSGQTKQNSGESFELVNVEENEDACLAKFEEHSDWHISNDGSFEWDISEFYSKECSEQQGSLKIESTPFKIGKYQWKILLYPYGNSLGVNKFSSLYMLCSSIDDDNQLEVCAQFIANLTLSSGDEIKLLASNYCSHRYDHYEKDWGFSRFYSSEKLKQMHAVGKIKISVQVRIVDDDTGILWHNFINYNSKKVTGYVGFGNQGATCYMNSLLQSFFCTPAFVRFIYSIPTEGESCNENNALALQRIFWNLANSTKESVSTRELTSSFGWDTMESFIQSDVQEFSRVLLDDLEERTKLSSQDPDQKESEGEISRLFVGKVTSVIECLNVPFKSTRTESFYDLQLTIRGMKSLQESFDNYVKEEFLIGDNQYRADNFGLQDARKFIEFEKFPPILHLHLERYTFDPQTMGTIKINDRLEFPESLNLDKYLSSEKKNSLSDSNEYILQCVFVHSGDSHGGHYFVFIKDFEKNKWFKFDDTRVTPATEKEAIDDNFGGMSDSEQSGCDDIESINRQRPRYMSRKKYKRFTNAYMLVYIKASRLNEILRPIDPETEVPSHVAEGIIRDQQALEAKHLASLQTKLYIVESDQKYHGPDFFNLENENIAEFTVPIETTVFLEKTISDIRKELSINCGEFWTFNLRRNGTIRPDCKITPDNESLRAIKYFLDKSWTRNKLILYLNKSVSKITDARQSSFENDKVINILYKYFDGKTLVNLKMIPVFFGENVSSKRILKSLFDVSKIDTSLFEYSEEVNPQTIKSLDKDICTFEADKFYNGDIVTIYKSADLNKMLEYYDILCHKTKITFVSSEDKENSFVEFFDDRVKIDSLVEYLSDMIKEDVSFIQLSDIDAKRPVLTSEYSLHIHDLFLKDENVSSNGISIFWKKTNIPVIEMEKFNNVSLFDLETHLLICSILVDFKKDTCLDVLKRIPKRSLPTNDLDSLILIELKNSNEFKCVYFIQDSLEKFENTNIDASLFVSKKPQNIEIGKIVPVQGFMRDYSSSSLVTLQGIPELFISLPGEKISSVIERYGKSLLKYKHRRVFELDPDVNLYDTISDGETLVWEQMHAPQYTERSIKIRSSTPK